jgi:hypothetical protein
MFIRIFISKFVRTIFRPVDHAIDRLLENKQTAAQAAPLAHPRAPIAPATVAQNNWQTIPGTTMEPFALANRATATMRSLLPGVATETGDSAPVAMFGLMALHLKQHMSADAFAAYVNSPGQDGEVKRVLRDLLRSDAIFGADLDRATYATEKFLAIKRASGQHTSAS